MTTFKYAVKTPIGTVKRTSVRVYKFVIVGNERDALYHAARSLDAINYQVKKLREYEQVVATGVVPNAYRMLSVADYERFVEQTQSEVERLKAVPDSRFEELANGTICFGWSGDRRNAEKVALHARNRGYRNVTVVDVR